MKRGPKPKRKRAIRPRNVGENELCKLLAQCMTERNVLRIVKIREYRPLVMKAFFRDYISGMIKSATMNSGILDTNREKLGSIHILQYPSRNSAAWDKEHGMIDCKPVLTHDYAYAEVTFDDAFRYKALKEISNGRSYLTKKYDRKGSF